MSPKMMGSPGLVAGWMPTVHSSPNLGSVTSKGMGFVVLSRLGMIISERGTLMVGPFGPPKPILTVPAVSRKAHGILELDPSHNTPRMLYTSWTISPGNWEFVVPESRRAAVAGKSGGVMLLVPESVVIDIDVQETRNSLISWALGSDG